MIKNDYSQVEEITGNLSINSEAKLDSLQTVGGNLYINSNAKLEANVNIKYNVKEVIELTTGQYGNETFKEFFEENGKCQ